MHSGNIIVSTQFGDQFEMVIGYQSPSDPRLPAHTFYDTVFAMQFVAQLNIGEYQWPALLGNWLQQVPLHETMPYRVAALVVRGVVRFFKLPSLRNATPIHAEPGKALVFLPATGGTRQNMAAERLAVSTASEAEHLVSGLSSQQITQALVDAGELSPLQNQHDQGQARQLLIEKLSDGSIAAWKIAHQPHAPTKKAATDVVPAANMPGNRKVPLGPESETATTFKREHKAGAKTDPYTLQEDGKPMGAKEGIMPLECFGLDEQPEHHDELVAEGFPNLNVEYQPGKFAKDFANFSDAKPDLLPPGTKIYRIIDEAAHPAGSYWATELPASKTAWRGDYAVKDSWNDNGYYTEYIVPEGESLKVWRGKTAGQEYREHEGKNFYLEGGKEQLFLTRDAVSPSPRTHTNWSDAKL